MTGLDRIAPLFLCPSFTSLFLMLYWGSCFCYRAYCYSYGEKGKKTSASVGGLGLWADGIVWDECSLDLCSCFSWVHPGPLIPRKFQLLLRVAGLSVALTNLWRHDSCLKARKLKSELILNGPNLHRWEALAWLQCTGLLVEEAKQYL